MRRSGEVCIRGTVLVLDAFFADGEVDVGKDVAEDLDAVFYADGEVGGVCVGGDLVEVGDCVGGDDGGFEAVVVGIDIWGVCGLDGLGGWGVGGLRQGRVG